MAISAVYNETIINNITVRCCSFCQFVDISIAKNLLRLASTDELHNTEFSLDDETLVQTEDGLEILNRLGLRPEHGHQDYVKIVKECNVCPSLAETLIQR